ncbi:MAG: invasion associated locus B family protein, partial [Alphaproteobacteria bacterium]
TVSVNIGGTLFTMFTQADSAWLFNEAEESNLLAAMKAGSDMTISGMSRRGNKTTYRMSLSGVTAAANKILSECN